MAILRLDGQPLRSLIAARLSGGVPELQARWSSSNPADTEHSEPPHRATLHRWTQGQVPRTADDLLRLCGILDVDPMCLLNLPEDNPEATIERLLATFIRDRWDPPTLEFLKGFMGRRSLWPPPELARKYFDREWFTQELAHDAKNRANFYATLRIAPSAPTYREGPFIYHVAFRQPKAFGERWLQFGVVMRHGNRISLRHINGHTEDCDALSKFGDTLFETWFGPSSAVIRVASLHPFALNSDEQGRPTKSIVRFPG